jgi:hypothetical protein
MKIAYIAHKISGDIEANLTDLRRIIRAINIEYPDVVPFCPYYVDIVSLDDNVPAERERGIANDTELICRGFIDEVWLTGDSISTGMKSEADMAAIFGIPVIDYTGLF